MNPFEAFAVTTAALMICGALVAYLARRHSSNMRNNQAWARHIEQSREIDHKLDRLEHLMGIVHSSTADQELRLRLMEQGVVQVKPDAPTAPARARGSWRDIASRAEAGSDKNGALDEVRK
jgi:hypothetical protein